MNIKLDKNIINNQNDKKINDQEKKNQNNNNSSLESIVCNKAEINLDGDLYLEENVLYFIITQETCFYSESGGQVGDVGVIYLDNKISSKYFSILDTQKIEGFVIHKGYLRGGSGTINMSNQVKLSFFEDTRLKTMKNHTGTHLLNHTLRRFLTGVEQKGSLVDANKIRFDFSYGKSLSIQDLESIENYMNGLIKKKIAVKTYIKKFNEIAKENKLLIAKC